MYYNCSFVDDIGSQDNENFPKSNVIRAEPSLDTDTKEDVKDAVGSTDTRCAQVRRKSIFVEATKIEDLSRLVGKPTIVFPSRSDTY